MKLHAQITRFIMAIPFVPVALLLDGMIDGFSDTPFEPIWTNTKSVLRWIKTGEKV